MVNKNNKIKGLSSAVAKIVVSVCLVMIAICIPLSVGAASESFEDIKGFLQSIGIEVNIRDPKAVTRGEFVELLGKAFKLDSEYLPDTDPFEDVYNYDLVAAYVGPFKDMGIIKGDDGRFYPNKAITINEVAAFTVRSMAAFTVRSTDDQRYLLGVNLFECFSKAKRSNFFAGVNESGSSITEEDAYRIIYNYLIADLYGTRNFKTKEQQKGNTLLWCYHSLYKVDGVVKSNDVTGLYTEKDADNERAIIGDNTYRMDTAEARDLVGYRVIAFADDTLDEIKYIFPYKNDVKIVTSEDEPRYNNFVMNYYDRSSKARSVKVAKNFSFLYNGVASEFNVDKLIPKSTTKVGIQNLPSYGEIELIDNDDDGTYDVIKTWNYLYLYSDSVKPEEWRIFDKNNRDQSIYIDLGEEDSKYDAYMNDGSTTERCVLESFTDGCVIKYAVSETGEYVKIIGCYVSVEGAANGKSVEGIDSIVTIDGIDYEVNSYFEKYYLSEINLDQKCKFVLDEDGKLAALVNLTDVMRYGYLVAAQHGKGLAANEVKVKVLNSAGTYEILELKKKILLDGVSVGENSTQVQDILFPAGKNPYQIVKYSVDDNGELNRLDTLDDNTGFVKYQEPVNIYDSLNSYWDGTLKYKTFGYFVPYAFVSGATTFFFVPPSAKTGLTDLSDEQFNVDGTSYFSGDRSYPVQIFDIDSAGMAKAVVVYQDASQKPINDLSTWGVVSKIRNVFTEDGDETIQIEYWQSGTYSRVQLDTEAAEPVRSKVESLKCGDLIRFSVRNDRLVNIEVDFSYENNQTDNIGSDDALFQIKYMTPYRVVGDIIYEDNGETKSMYKLSPSMHYVRYDVENKKLVNATVEDIKDITRYGAAGAKMVCARMQYSIVNAIIIID